MQAAAPTNAFAGGLLAILAGLPVMAYAAETATQSASAPAASMQQETPWPHAVKSGDTTLLVYQPQLESHTDDGWQQMTRDSGGQSSNLDSNRAQRLDQDRAARNLGEGRYRANRQSMGTMQRLGAGRRR